MTDVGTLALLTMLGAVVGLDFVSFPQAMLSRPLVASTLAGALCGDAATGLLVGVLLECFALETMPFGASRYPEWGPASVAAGAVASLHSGDAAAARLIPFAVLAGLACAFAGGQTLVWLRRFNLVVAERYREELTRGDAAAVLAVQWTGLVVDFGRAGAVTALYVVLLVPARHAVGAALHPGTDALAMAVTGTVAVGVAGGAAWKVVHTAKGYQWWLLAGVLIGTVAAVLK
jgi:mannose/fructose/N-acetylgalactosamine-specific phosphotransferase system component IIC